MAEGILKDIVRKNNLDIEVKSAGVFAMDKDKVSQKAVEALKKLDMDISHHKAQNVTKKLVDEADLILTMSTSHKKTLLLNYPDIKGKVFLLNKYALKEDRDIQDPFGRDLYNYEIARDEILKALISIKW